jgi:hypothetical protein
MHQGVNGRGLMIERLEVVDDDLGMIFATGMMLKRNLFGRVVVFEVKSDHLRSSQSISRSQYFCVICHCTFPRSTVEL